MNCTRLLLACLAAAVATAPQATEPRSTIDRPPQDEIVYFILPDRFANGDEANDRGGIEGGRNQHGFDPADRGFYQGGDLKGVRERLDYIQGLGATAIWLSPIFRNKAVQVLGEGEGGDAGVTAGYHGYWITDFLDVDPHLGTREDFRAFVDAAHARGMKVYMDIITNHTADVIRYRECHDPEWTGERVPGCPYRSIGAYPWTTIGGPAGEAINAGFLGDDPEFLTDENFAALTNVNWAYHPYNPPGEETRKNPSWLNELRYYHNRGNTTFQGENSLYGDFIGLDDLNTQHPTVIKGMIDIYRQWITDFRVDGFRVDTTKHVRPEFWQQFVPAILAHASAEGIDHFHIFGEVYETDPAHLARWTIEGRMPSTLDFAFQHVTTAVLGGQAPAEELRRLFDADAIYPGGRQGATLLPTFLGNHDMGRFSGFLKAGNPEQSDDELERRTRLGHALMLFARGVPVIYYGDEQGFVSDDGGLGARESMFPSATPDHADNDLIGTDATPADDNFDTEHPLYRSIAELSRIRLASETLRRGIQRTRHADLDGGLFVFSRLLGEAEIVVAINAGSEQRTINVPVGGKSVAWRSLLGTCGASSPASGSYAIAVPALDVVVCEAADAP